MREISSDLITSTLAEMCIEANHYLTPDMEAALKKAGDQEVSPLGKQVLTQLRENLKIADEETIPICQDTGMAVIFLEIGQDVLLSGAPLEKAVNEGVAGAYTDGYMRKSVVRDPLFERVNTNDNTPAVLYTAIVSGENVKITVAPKGFGSENMSRTKMFTPSAKPEDITAFVVETVHIAGGNPCPPVVVGVGLGGTFDYAAFLAKKALCRDIAVRHPDARYAAFEAEMLAQINTLGIGPQGFGGDTTALAVNIETYPTHIAGLPCAVNIGCHVTRHRSAVL